MITPDHAEQIKKAMAIRDINGAILGKMTRINKTLIYQIINYKRTMSVLNAKRIAKALVIVSAKDLLIGQVEYQLNENNKPIRS